MKYFIWLIIVISITTLWCFHRIRSTSVKNNYFKGDINHKKSGQTESMVQCSSCGLYFPASEALKKIDSGAIYCSKDHLKSPSNK